MPPTQPTPNNPDAHSSRAIPVWVTSVPDGDSLWVVRDPNAVDSELPVRLFGIDAPERGQDFGSEAQQALWRLVWRTKGLRMEVVDVDHYHRLVVLLYHQSAGRQRSINRILIEQGHARWYSRFGGGGILGSPPPKSRPGPTGEASGSADNRWPLGTTAPPSEGASANQVAASHSWQPPACYCCYS